MDFNDAYADTMQAEGGYVNDKDDRGGETYKGISRKFHPEWVGWEIIDTYKSEYPEDFEEHLEDDVMLQMAVKGFYYNHYWLPLHCEQLPFQIAAELFDTGVNMGEQTAVRILQKSLNLLNKNQTIFDDLKVDGIIGPKTISAAHKVNPRKLLKVMNGYQFMHYANIMENNPLYEKYTGWFNRI